MQLNVFIDGVKVGRLDRVAVKDASLFYRFRYLEGVAKENQVSLTMPVRDEPYLLKKMPAVFDMLLPEGDRRDTIAKLSKLGHITDLKLLSIVGSNTIGRVQLSEGECLSEPVKFNHDDIVLCKDSQALFDKLLNEHGFKSGVSGVQPKVLGKEIYGGDQGDAPASEARTIICSTDIIKHTSGEFPCLVLNEYACMQAAAASGIDVPECDLSMDGDLLAIKRFDVDIENDRHYGFEEMASLKGQIAEDKYQGSFDVIALEIEERVSSEHMLDDLESLFKQLAFNVMIRNGDSHMKNFGLLYADGDVRLSPAYDLVTTVVYEEKDVPAICLSEDVYDKRWWSKDEIYDFGQEYCYLSNKQMDAIFGDIEKGLTRTATAIDGLIMQHPHFAETGRKLKGVWQETLNEYGLNGDNINLDGHLITGLGQP